MEGQDIEIPLCALLFAVMSDFIFWKKTLFVREIFCKMQKLFGSAEQVGWYTGSARISTSSKQCCLFPKSVGIYLKQRKGCFK